MQICNQCHYTNNNDATFCNRCGSHLKGIENPLIDRIIDKYRLKERIGGGGFGTVYRALHVELDNPFAIKILHPHLLHDELMVQRFKREARLLASLRHNNIVQVIDFGHIDGIGFYLVMEWLDGKTLQWHLKHEGLPPYEVLLQIFEQLLDALGYAHSQGVVHRDLKPENLVLLPGSRMRRTLKILDFGIATMVTDRGTSRLTETGLAVGTPRYMSPEQAAGELDRVDHRADIYSVGVLLVELLTGKHLFTGTTNEILLHQIETPAPLLSDLVPEQSYPPAMQWVLQRALAKEPEKRFASAAAFSDALLAILEGDTTHVSPQSSPIHPGAALPIQSSGAAPISGLSEAISNPVLPSFEQQTPTHALSPTASRPLRPRPAAAGAPSTSRVETRALPPRKPQPPPSLLDKNPPPTNTGYRGEKQSGQFPHNPKAPAPSSGSGPLFWGAIMLLAGLGLGLFILIIGMLGQEDPDQVTLHRPLPPKGPGSIDDRYLPKLTQPSTRAPRPVPALPRVLQLPDRAPTPERVAEKAAPPLPPPLRRTQRQRIRRRRPRRRIRRRRRRRIRRRRIRRRRRRIKQKVAIWIKSIPGGATVFINGAKRAVTPYKLLVTTGQTIEVKLTKQGYFLQKKSFKIKQTDTKIFRLVKNIF